MKKRGFSLLEVCVTFFLLGLILLAAAGLFPGSALALRKSDHRCDAGSVAEAALETERAQGFSQLRLGVETLPPRTVEGIVFNCQREVFADPATPASILKGVRVTVTWKFQNYDGHLVRETWLSALKS